MSGNSFQLRTLRDSKGQMASMRKLLSWGSRRQLAKALEIGGFGVAL